MGETISVDVLIVGAGPAGTAAALVCARAGLQTLLLERGPYPGAKNVMGGIMYGHNLAELIPDFCKPESEGGAPLERPIMEQRLILTTEGGDFSLRFRHDDFKKQPYNSFSVLRAKFDRWFAQKAEEAGAMVLCETTAVECTKDAQGRVTGVKTDREDPIEAKVTIICDGVNSLLSKKLGLHPELTPKQVAIAMKEVVKLDPAKIDERFNVKDGFGVACEVFGSSIGGLLGQGWVYTNKDTISLGMGCLASELWKHKLKPYEALERYKQHPSIKCLLEGTELVEYSAHLIPELSYDELPPCHGDGFMVCGDAAGLVNAIHREGSNLAMTSGKFAGETAIEIIKANKPATKAATKAYLAKLQNSFIHKDLKKYRHAIHTFLDAPRFTAVYPSLIADVARKMWVVDGKPKREKFQSMFSQLKAGAGGLFRLLWDGYKGWKAMGKPPF